jgi:hypothetical protein
VYSNWSYLVGLLKASKETSSTVQSVEKHQPFPYLFFLIMGILKYLVLHLKQQIVKDPKLKSILMQELLKEQVMMKRRNTSQRIIRR